MYELFAPTFVEEVKRYIVPIFIDRNNVPVSVGSGFLVRAADVHLLITAAHVLEPHKPERPFYFYIAPATKRLIHGTVILTRLPPGRTRNEDAIDIGIVILANEGLPPYLEIGKSAMSIETLAPRSLPREPNKYAFLGYPASQGRANRATKNVASWSYAYLSSPVPKEQYSRLGLSDDSHIVLSFDAKKIFHPDGRRMNFPKPAGISGSPLWEVHNLAEGGCKVVGVMIEYRKQQKVLVAADIGFALRMLEEYRSRRRAGRAGDDARME
jgi:hypothetical protein